MDKVHENTRIVPRMSAGGGGAGPGQAPPDLPSLLLDGRICFIGMPVRASHEHVKYPLVDSGATMGCKIPLRRLIRLPPGLDSQMMSALPHNPA